MRTARQRKRAPVLCHGRTDGVDSGYCAPLISPENRDDVGRVQGRGCGIPDGFLAVKLTNPRTVEKHRSAEAHQGTPGDSRSWKSWLISGGPSYSFPCGSSSLRKNSLLAGRYAGVAGYRSDAGPRFLPSTCPLAADRLLSQADEEPGKRFVHPNFFFHRKHSDPELGRPLLWRFEESRRSASAAVYLLRERHELCTKKPGIKSIRCASFDCFG